MFFHSPYPATPLFATLMRLLHPGRFCGTKTAGVCTNNSQIGTSAISTERNSLELGPKRNSASTVRSISKSSRCNTYGHVVCVADKGLTNRLNSLDATLTENTGWGVSDCNFSTQFASHSHGRKLAGPLKARLVTSASKVLASNQEKYS